MGELFCKYVMYADDQVTLAPSACELQDKVTEINDSINKRGNEHSDSQFPSITPYHHPSSSFPPSAYYFLPRYPIPIQQAGNALLTLL
ncbi:hypothetical protein EVAR_8069_1 [Eumeta japonica]|uniref:Reverse transcriptase domain-containing protein n=1 Tax=Eumeta variegata TaxID=151549 RepID=A0A4C1TSW5_EUMVA|nr:hypothetical protein EVAR_8069_1 [Eumeta japonica]